MHSKLIDRLYLLGILTAVTWVLAYPTWTGQSYTLDYDLATETGSYTEPNGTFALASASGAIWSPPNSGSELIDSAVRMPWESPIQEYHVEIHIAVSFARLFLCTLVLGVLHRISLAVTQSTASMIGSVAWSVSMLSIIGFLVLCVIGVFTMGFGLTDQVLMGGMIAPLTTGVVYGVFQHMSNNNAESEAVAPSNTSWSGCLGWHVTGLATGLAMGFPLMLAIYDFVFQFRPRYEFPYGPVDRIGHLMVGFAMLFIVWSVGLALWKWVPAGLRNGFLFSATSLAIICCVVF